MITGPMVGGVLFTAGGFPAPFFVTAAAFLVAGVVVLFSLTHQGKSLPRHSISLIYFFCLEQKA